MLMRIVALMLSEVKGKNWKISNADDRVAYTNSKQDMIDTILNDQ